MSRFVRILPVDPDRLPGERLRLERLTDGSIVLSSETVFPERVHDPDAHHYTTHDLLDLNPARLLWVHQSTGELLSTIALADVESVPVDTAAPEHRDDEKTAPGKRPTKDTV